MIFSALVMYVLRAVFAPVAWWRAYKRRQAEITAILEWEHEQISNMLKLQQMEMDEQEEIEAQRCMIVECEDELLTKMKDTDQLALNG